jgi:hypothetical protein
LKRELDTIMNEDLPRDENYEEALDEAIDEALEGDLRAEEWRRLKHALLRRRAMLQEDLRATTDEAARKKLVAELEQADEHIAALAEEENITRFVEETVRFSSEVRRLQQGG